LGGRRGSIYWFIANVVGAFLFLFVGATWWIEPELAEVPGAIGAAPFFWVLTTLPILALYVVLDIGPSLWAISVRVMQGFWPVSRYIWLCLPIWVGVIVVDSFHHGT